MFAIGLLNNLFWASYYFLLILGMGLIALRLVIAEVGLKHFLFFFYIVLVLILAAAAKQIIVVVLVISAPFILFTTRFFRQYNKKRDILNNVVNELNQCRKAIAINPDNGAAFERIGEIYEQLGDIVHTKKFYETANKIQSTEKLAYKLEQLAKEPNIMKSVTSPHYRCLRSCLRCGQVNLRFDHICSSCQLEFFSDYLSIQIAKPQNFLDEYAITGILIAGIAFLPYLFKINEVAYATLWAIWSFGLLIYIDV